MRLTQGEGHGGVDGEGHGWLPACDGSEAEQIPRDDHALDLAGALDDLDLLGVVHEKVFHTLAVLPAIRFPSASRIFSSHFIHVSLLSR